MSSYFPTTIQTTSPNSTPVENHKQGKGTIRALMFKLPYETLRGLSGFRRYRRRGQKKCGVDTSPHRSVVVRLFPANPPLPLRCPALPLQLKSYRPGSPPTAAHINMASTAVFVMVGHPTRARMRRTVPSTTTPLPASSLPSPSAADPNIPVPGHGSLDIDARSGRGSIHFHFRGSRNSHLAARAASLDGASSRQQTGAGNYQDQFYQVVIFHIENIPSNRPKSICQLVRKTLIEASCRGL
jgi:hypothetical protein